MVINELLGNLNEYVFGTIISVVCVLLILLLFRIELKKQEERKPLMKNFPFIYKGLTYWYSRSCAVVLFVFCKDKNNEYYILANKRGKGTPDYQGCWNVPCGYLDFNEDGKEGAIREVREETGVNVPYEKVKLVEVASSPTQNRQNVTLRHTAILDGTIDDYLFSKKENEEGEVDDIAWIKVDSKEIEKYKWAFEHDFLIQHMYYLISNGKINDCSV